MTVGKALSQATGYKLLHNHVSIEVALGFFDHGTDGFFHISESIRTAVFDAVLDSDLDGLIFTFMWAYDSEDDCQYVSDLTTKWEASEGGNVFFLELYADSGTKKRRNTHPDRLKAKPSKRNIKRSEESRLKFEKNHQLNSNGRFPLSYPHVCIDNSEMEPADVINMFLEAVNLQ